MWPEVRLPLRLSDPESLGLGSCAHRVREPLVEQARPGGRGQGTEFPGRRGRVVVVEMLF